MDQAESHGISNTSISRGDSEKETKHAKKAGKSKQKAKVKTPKKDIGKSSNKCLKESNSIHSDVNITKIAKI